MSSQLDNQRREAIDLVAGILATIPGMPSKDHPTVQRQVAEQIVTLVESKLMQPMLQQADLHSELQRRAQNFVDSLTSHGIAAEMSAGRGSLDIDIKIGGTE